MKISARRLVPAIAAVMALMMVGYTWAFFTSTSAIDNDLQTKGFGSRTVEVFPPEQDMVPGAEITKAVGVTNTGNYPLVVRIKFDEEWSRNNVVFKSIAHNGKIDTVDAGTLKANQAGGVAGETDGLVPTTADEETVVFKKLNAGAANTFKWVKGSDGYFYFKTLLPESASTDNLMDYIKLAVNTDLGKQEVKMYYSTVAVDDSTLVAAQTAYKAANDAYIADPTNTTKRDAMKNALATLEPLYLWTDVKPADNLITFKKSEDGLAAGLAGYAKADYTLTVTTDVCQATKEAITAEWGTIDTSIMTGWGF